MKNFKMKLLSMLMIFFMAVGMIGTNVTTAFAESKDYTKSVNTGIDGINFFAVNKEATEKIEWLSSDETIAKVDGNGKITAVKEGQTTASAINILIDGISSKITIDDWAALDLNKAGKAVPKEYLVKLEEKIKAAKGIFSAATDYERTVLGILGAGGDPTNFGGYNLVEKIYNNTGISAPNAYIFGLIALDAGNFTIPDTAKWSREKLIQKVLDCKTEDGGWSFGGGKADPDMTAMALSALAPYCDKNAAVKEAVGKAVEILSTLQTEKGGFKSWGSENSNSAAMVIIGLCDTGINPMTDVRFVKAGNNPMDALLSFAVSDNSGFGFTDNKNNNSMATEQGLRALAAYKLFQAGKGSVYKGFTVNKPENPKMFISPQSVEVFPGESFTLKVTSEKGNVITYVSDIKGMDKGFKVMVEGEITYTVSKNIKPGVYSLHDIGLHEIPANIPPARIPQYINDKNKIASLSDVKVVVKGNQK